MKFIRLPIVRTHEGEETASYEICTSLGNVSLKYDRKKKKYSALIRNVEADGSVINLELNQKTHDNILEEMRVEGKRAERIEALLDPDCNKDIVDGIDSNMDGLEV
jgi:hypothetical protein